MIFFNHHRRHGIFFELSCLFCIGFLLAGIACPAPAGQANGKKEADSINSGLTGSDIMDQVFKRHLLLPYVYEEQTLVLTDNEGNKDVKKLCRFSRVETDGSLRYLLVFDNPEEVRGFSLIITRDPGGIVQSRIYLPALGEPVSSGFKKNMSRDFMGTDLSIADLVDTRSDVIYTRKADHFMAKQKAVACFVVDASPGDDTGRRTRDYGIRRHYIRQDNFMIVRTDYFDHGHRLLKRMTRHDLRKTDKDVWQSNMLLMENIRDQHTTLIKIDRRVLSRDYVPTGVFTASWLKEKYPVRETEKTGDEQPSTSPAQDPVDGTNHFMGN